MQNAIKPALNAKHTRTLKIVTRLVVLLGLSLSAVTGFRWAKFEHSGYAASNVAAPISKGERR